MMTRRVSAAITPELEDIDQDIYQVDDIEPKYSCEFLEDPMDRRMLKLYLTAHW